MSEPIFWLGCSFLLVAVCLTVVLVTAIPAFQELARAARSAEKLFDTLHRELPPTLEAIRLTGIEISDLTDDISDGVENAGHVVKQVDESFRTAQRQVQAAGVTTRSVFAGVHAAWKSLTRSPKRRRSTGRNRDRLSASQHPPIRYQSHPGDRPETVPGKTQTTVPSPTSAESLPITDLPITEAIETFPEE